MWRVPDPRDPKAPKGGKCDVVFGEGIIRHIAPDHWSGTGEEAQAWRDWLGDDLVNAGIQMSQRVVGHPESASVVTGVADAMGDAVQAAFSRPLVLIKRNQTGMKSKKSGKGGLDDAWLVVLPNGALVVVRRVKSTFRVVTAYFKKCALVETRPVHRWRSLVRFLVAMHRGSSSNQFVTLDSWGFRTDVKGCPWAGRLGSWGKADVPSPLFRLDRRLERGRGGSDDGQS